jgi:hypothetical protein
MFSSRSEEGSQGRAKRAKLLDGPRSGGYLRCSILRANRRTTLHNIKLQGPPSEGLSAEAMLALRHLVAPSATSWEYPEAASRGLGDLRLTCSPYSGMRFVPHQSQEESR